MGCRVGYQGPTAVVSFSGGHSRAKALVGNPSCFGGIWWTGLPGDYGKFMFLLFVFHVFVFLNVLFVSICLFVTLLLFCFPFGNDNFPFTEYMVEKASDHST